MPLSIAIVGAGLAGLTAAIALADRGHAVTVYERRDDDDRGASASGIQLQPNALRVLERLRMLTVVDAVAYNGSCVDARDYRTGETLGLIDIERRGGNRYATRRRLKAVVVEEAVRRGVLVRKGLGVESVGEVNGQPVVRLSDGSRIAADLVVGADGTWSRVRKSLFPNYRPTVLSTVCFQVQIPEEHMKSNAALVAMERNHPAASFWCSPDRFSIAGPAPTEKLFDMQFFDMDYPLDKDPNPNVHLGWVTDVEALRLRFSDHVSGVQQVLAKAERYYKWRLVEVSGLPSWSNWDGNVVLIGDACHAMTPYAGQGSAMGIEDAAVVAELLEGAKPGDDLKDRLKLYEKIRRPQCESVQKYAATLGRMWSTSDEQMMKKVRHAILASNDPSYLRINPDKTAKFHSPAFEKWLDLYDASVEIAKVSRNLRVQSRL